MSNGEIHILFARADQNSEFMIMKELFQNGIYENPLISQIRGLPLCVSLCRSQKGVQDRINQKVCRAVQSCRILLLFVPGGQTTLFIRRLKTKDCRLRGIVLVQGQVINYFPKTSCMHEGAFPLEAGGGQLHLCTSCNKAVKILLKTDVKA